MNERRRRSLASGAIMRSAVACAVLIAASAAASLVTLSAVSRHARPRLRGGSVLLTAGAHGSGDYRWPSADESAPPPNFVPGHVFVVQGDVTQMNADAVLVPSRSINSPKWFPDGPPDGLRASTHRSL